MACSLVPTGAMSAATSMSDANAGNTSSTPVCRRQDTIQGRVPHRCHAQPGGRMWQQRISPLHETPPVQRRRDVKNRTAQNLCRMLPVFSLVTKITL